MTAMPLTRGRTTGSSLSSFGAVTESAHREEGGGASTADWLRLALELEPDFEAASRAREALEQLDDHLEEQVLEDMRLLVTELVTNSVRHTRAETVVLRILVGRSAVWTEVTDAGPGFDPPNSTRTANDATGWGLFLVERLAERWGVNQSDAGTKVWFELRRA